MLGQGRVGHRPTPSPSSYCLSYWSNPRAPGLASGKPRRGFPLTSCVTFSSPFTSLSLSSLSGHHPLSHKMKWHIQEQEATCKELKCCEGSLLPFPARLVADLLNLVYLPMAP